MTPIYLRTGEYFAFVKNNRLFSADCDYLGWITDDGRVWRADGSFLGEIVDEKFVMRRKSMARPARRARRARPARPARPARRANIAQRSGKSGWVDALQEYLEESDE